MATAAAEETKIEVGRVIQRAVEALARHLFAYPLLALLLVGVPSVAYEYRFAAAFEADPTWFLFGVGYWLNMALVTVAATLLQAVVVSTAIRDLGGHSADVVGILAGTLKLIPRLVALSLLVLLVTAVGFALLVVPGFIAWAALAVAVPAMVDERRGVIASMERSAALTHGSRWRIFALLLIYLGAYLVVGVGTEVPTLFGAVYSPEISAASVGLVEAIAALIIATLTAALYVELKIVKEGAAAGTLAAVFE